MVWMGLGGKWRWFGAAWVPKYEFRLVRFDKIVPSHVVWTGFGVGFDPFQGWIITGTVATRAAVLLCNKDQNSLKIKSQACVPYLDMVSGAPEFIYKILKLSLYNSLIDSRRFLMEPIKAWVGTILESFEGNKAWLASYHRRRQQ